ncbi:MAG: hypothetical protein WCW44_06070, partial [archaeon]
SVIGQVDRFIVSGLHATPEQKSAGLKVLHEGQLLSVYGAKSMGGMEMSKEVYADAIRKATLDVEKLSHRRIVELEQVGFKPDQLTIALSRVRKTPGKEVVPDMNTIQILKQINFGLLWDALGEDAAFVYRKTYGEVKPKLLHTLRTLTELSDRRN